MIRGGDGVAEWTKVSVETHCRRLKFWHFSTGADISLGREAVIPRPGMATGAQSKFAKKTHTFLKPTIPTPTTTLQTSYWP